MKKGRAILGLLLIIFAASGLIFWEVKGREVVLLDTVLVASERIPAGTAITRDVLTVTGIPKENRISGAIDADRLQSVVGQVVLQDVVKNGQVSQEYLSDDDFYLRGEQSIYVLDPDWIFMRSSSIRRGDWVDIYENIGHQKLGTCRVAFVKDINEIEVTDGEGQRESAPLNRVASSSPVSHVEIIADINEYKKITDCVINDSAGLLLVQKGVALK